METHLHTGHSLGRFHQHFETNPNHPGHVFCAIETAFTPADASIETEHRVGTWLACDIDRLRELGFLLNHEQETKAATDSTCFVNRPEPCQRFLPR